jgi:hypothetical protein
MMPPESASTARGVLGNGLDADESAFGPVRT